MLKSQWYVVAMSEEDALNAEPKHSKATDAFAELERVTVLVNRPTNKGPRVVYNVYSILSEVERIPRG